MLGGAYAAFPFARGATWSAGAVRNGEAWIGLRLISPFSTTFGTSSFTNQYYLFQFNGNAGAEYGWIELSLSVTKSNLATASDGPNVNVVQYGFDRSGALIGAGDGEAPEPSSLAESARRPESYRYN